MRRKLSHAILALAAGAVGAPAGAQMVSAARPDTIVKAMQGAGYAAKLETDSTGDPMIVSGAGGTAFRVLFYGCETGRNCETIQFAAGYDKQGETPLATVNDWNRTQRFGRAFIDTEGDPILQMDVDLDDGGVSNALFTDNLEYWVAVKQGFEKHIGWGK